MATEPWVQIAERFGVPVAVLVFCLFVFFVVLKEVIKGVKWCGGRLLGDGGFITGWFTKQVELIDTIQKNDDRSTDALYQLTESTRATTACLEKMVAKEDSNILKSWQKWGEIHQDVIHVKQNTDKLVGKKID